jgi:hypothetical protein
MPAPSMDLHGRIHTNEDLYLNVNNGRTLSIGDDPPDMKKVQIPSVGQMYRGGHKTYTGDICTGTVIIDKLEDADSNGNFDSLELVCSGGGPTAVSETIQAAYLGSLLSCVLFCGLKMGSARRLTLAQLICVRMVQLTWLAPRSVRA